MNSGDEAEQEAVVSNCSVLSFRQTEALGQPAKIRGIET